MFELYDKLINAYKSENEDSFSAAARNWIEAEENAPFNNDEYNEFYYAAKRNCRIWRSNAINSRSARVKMINNVRELMKLGVPNPYTPEPQESAAENKQEEQQKNESDIIYISELMAKAYAENDKVTFEQDAIHLYDIKAENPYHNNTPKYDAYAKMIGAKSKKEMLHFAGEYCDVINGKKKTILGVLPKKKEGK